MSTGEFGVNQSDDAGSRRYEKAGGGMLGIVGEWQKLANCNGVDPDLFFPERGASTREAKEVCRACMARPDCLEFAFVNNERVGIWGGLSERERRRLRRQRAQAGRPTSSNS